MRAPRRAFRQRRRRRADLLPVFRVASGRVRRGFRTRGQSGYDLVLPRPPLDPGSADGPAVAGHGALLRRRRYPRHRNCSAASAFPPERLRLGSSPGPLRSPSPDRASPQGKTSGLGVALPHHRLDAFLQILRPRQEFRLSKSAASGGARATRGCRVTPRLADRWTQGRPRRRGYAFFLTSTTPTLPSSRAQKRRFPARMRLV